MSDLQLFHGGNRGSNPLGGAIKINHLVRPTSGGVLEVCRTYPIPGDSAIFLNLSSARRQIVEPKARWRLSSFDVNRRPREGGSDVSASSPASIHLAPWPAVMNSARAVLFPLLSRGR
jgi:hypothetical protein